MSEAQLDRHRADLEAHRPFTDLIVRRRDPQGRDRLHSISGEPRYTPEGVFDGYRGVARDVTDEIRAQRAFAASETRYRELFESSPSPIFLHRHGVVFDANPSAARLFGFADTEAMKGMRMADLHPPGESRQRALDRIARLEQLQVGEGVPVRDFDARTVDGRPISVQATGVRVEAAGGPATLTIMFDITARLAAEAALRRSEAMLSQLFATSPDCIALYEAESGRLTLVNAAFSRLTGFAAEEVVGRTADELGLWHDPSDPVPAARRARRRRPHRRDAGAHRHPLRPARLGADLGGALHHGPARLRGRQRPRRHRLGADAARARGDLRARLDRHRPDPRPPLRPGRTRASRRSSAGRPASCATSRARRSGSTKPTTPRSASSPGRCSPPASRSRSSAR